MLFRSLSRGLGMILRNSAGDIIFTSCKPLERCNNPLESELRACVEGLKLAIHWTLLPIQVETDCASVVQLLQGIGRDFSVLANIIHEARHLLVGADGDAHKTGAAIDDVQPTGGLRFFRPAGDRSCSGHRFTYSTSSPVRRFFIY